MLLLKTHSSTIRKVVRHEKHALDAQPRLRRGELLLVAQTKDTLRVGRKPVQYLMEFERCYRDRDGESERIWGRRWNFIVQGTNCRRLRWPFDLDAIKVTTKSYGKGGPFMHVHEEDERMLRDSGYLECVPDPPEVTGTQ